MTLGPILAAAGVPLRFRDRTLDSYDPRRAKPGPTALAACRAMVDDPQTGLVLAGMTGTGKTHLAVGVIAARAAAWAAQPEGEEVLVHVSPESGDPISGDPPADHACRALCAVRYRGRRRFRDRFADVPRLLDDMRAWIPRHDGADPLDALTAADLLVLDDLGREKGTDWAVERLYLLVNTRYGDCKPTVVTTNYSLDELAERGYDAVLSRIVEGGGKIIRLEGRDQRMTAGANVTPLRTGL